MKSFDNVSLFTSGKRTCVSMRLYVHIRALLAQLEWISSLSPNKALLLLFTMNKGRVMSAKTYLHIHAGVYSHRIWMKCRSDLLLPEYFYFYSRYDLSRTCKQFGYDLIVYGCGLLKLFDTIANKGAEFHLFPQCCLNTNSHPLNVPP